MSYDFDISSATFNESTAANRYNRCPQVSNDMYCIYFTKDPSTQYRNALRFKPCLYNFPLSEQCQVLLTKFDDVIFVFILALLQVLKELLRRYAPDDHVQIAARDT